MTYVLVSRDPKSGLEARIAVPDQGQARKSAAGSSMPAATWWPCTPPPASFR